MAKKIELTVDEAYEIADSFAQASASFLNYRVENRNSLSQSQLDQLERCEDSLDSMVVLFRGYGIKLIGAEAESAVEELKSAIALGKGAIEKITKVKKAIAIAGAVVDLAVAVLAQDPKGILTAASGVLSVVGEPAPAAKKKDDK